MSKPTMVDRTPYNLAGINVPENLTKYANSIDQDGISILPSLRDFELNYSSMFRIMEQQNKIETLERYYWINVAPGLTADLIERVLFYRGKGVFYYNRYLQKFQFLPFALNGNIDEYGRYLKVNSLPFAGVTELDPSDNAKKIKEKLSNEQQPAIETDIEIMYDLPYSEEQLELTKKIDKIGIILNDSSLSISQEPVIRATYVRPVLHLLSTLMQIINAAMYGCADHSLIQVVDQGQVDSMNDQISAINEAILKGHRFTVVNSTLPITPIKSSNSVDIEGLFNTFNSLTNFLKSITGIANAGVFDKKAHLLQEEQELNGSNSDDVYYNGLRQRQEFCLLVQAYFGYPMWCESKREDTNKQVEDFAQGEREDTDDTQGITEGGE